MPTKLQDTLDPRPVTRMAYSTEEAAQILGLSVTTIRRLIRKKRLRPVPGLRHHVIPVSELERFLRGV